MRTAKGITLALAGFITFYFMFKKIPVNIYMGIYAAVMAIVLLSVGGCKNMRMLLQTILSGISITAGYGIAKLAYGCDLENIFSHMTPVRIVLTVSILIEYMIIFGLWRMSEKEKQQNRSKGNSGKPLELFSERISDLERMEEYLQVFDAVGVNGRWGSGKTFLVDEFIRRHQSNYEVIKVEPLTCNMDKIDSYLFKKLENVLWKNRIYPEYSRRLQGLMTRSRWTDKIYYMLYPDATSDLTAFEGFCADLEKLEKPVLLVYEDIDRISDENKDQIAKLLDLTAKLIQHNVKVIYEFDLKKMAALGYGYDYIEKYVPYTINLTPVSVKKLIGKALEELSEVNGDLKREDFDYLFVKVPMERFLQETFGFRLDLQVPVSGPAPRMVKRFVSEVNHMMGKGEYADKKYRRTVITFYFMKHFFHDIYEELDFENDMIDEVHLAMPSAGLERFYTVMELAAECKIGEAQSVTIPGEEEQCRNGVVSEDIKEMFIDSSSGQKNDIVIRNRNKLGLLILIGYKFGFQQEAVNQEILMQKEADNVRTGKRPDNVLLNQSNELIKNIEHNKKVSRLIRNLYANGRSEVTDAEAAAEVFVSDVLGGDQEEGKRSWKDFLNRVRRGDIMKDNRTVFRWGVNDWVSLFRALSIYVDRDEFDLSRKEQIIEKALDFYFVHGDHADELDFDKIVIFNYCSIDSNKIFIKILTRFRELKVTGNMNREKAYRDFLKNYSSHALEWGYLQWYDRFRLEMPFGGYSEKYSRDLTEYLKECCRQVEGIMKEGLYPEQGRRELELVRDFYKKNIEAAEASVEAKQTKMHVTITVSEEEEHMDEEVYEELSKYTAKSPDGAGRSRALEEEFTAVLEKYYRDGKLNLRKFREWKEKYRA